MSAQFYCIIVYIWKVESRVQIADWCASWKISSGADNLFSFAGAVILRGRCLPQNFMEVGLGPNEGCSAKGKKMSAAIFQTD
jgi:hypothetical protein